MSIRTSSGIRDCAYHQVEIHKPTLQTRSLLAGADPCPVKVSKALKPFTVNGMTFNPRPVHFRPNLGMGSR